MRLILTAVLLLAASTATAGVKAGDRAPSIRSAQTRTGKPISWKALRGEIVVLTFGASWCAPCKRELPAFDKVAVTLRGKEKHSVRFLAVNLDDEVAAGKRFVKSLGLDCVIPIFDPEGRIAASFGPPVMPTTYIVDRNGIVRHVHKGYKKGDARAIEKEVRKLL